MILKALTLGFVATNCYIVGSESTKQGIVIDPGAEAKVILRTVRDLGLTISLIVATHTHFDHIGALKSIKDETGAEIRVIPFDAKNQDGKCVYCGKQSTSTPIFARGY